MLLTSLHACSCAMIIPLAGSKRPIARVGATRSDRVGRNPSVEQFAVDPGLAAGPRLPRGDGWGVLRAGQPGLDGADEDALATDLVSGGLEADDAVAAVLG